MEESAPAPAAKDENAAPEETAAQDEKPAGKRRRIRAPMSVLVTLFVALLSVWVAPAITRQWEDRQNARALKLAVAQEMSAGTVHALSDGLAAAMVGDDVRPVLATWDVARLNVEAKLRLYFGEQITQRWNRLQHWRADAAETLPAELATPSRDRSRKREPFRASVGVATHSPAA